jgi:hypothetical protein
LNVIPAAILYDVEPPPKVQQMWCNLRKGLVYFTSYTKGQHRKALWVKARNRLLQNARMAEDSTQGGKRLCTQQLHSAVCHLVQHVELYGPSVRLALGGIMSLLYRYKGYVFLYLGYKGIESRYKQHFPTPGHEATADFQNDYTSSMLLSFMFRCSSWALNWFPQASCRLH